MLNIILHVYGNVYSPHSVLDLAFSGRVGEVWRNLLALYFQQVSRSVSPPGSRLLSPRVSRPGGSELLIAWRARLRRSPCTIHAGFVRVHCGLVGVHALRIASWSQESEPAPPLPKYTDQAGGRNTRHELRGNY